ncbi:MAG: hypothetical protein R3A47_07420 [Polyangiales bacterium]
MKLFERGLAYQNEVPVSWCPALGTVLANEEVINGLSERGNHPVERVPLRQWSSANHSVRGSFAGRFEPRRLAQEHSNDAERMDRSFGRR